MLPNRCQSNRSQRFASYPCLPIYCDHRGPLVLLRTIASDSGQDTLQRACDTSTAFTKAVNGYVPEKIFDQFKPTRRQGHGHRSPTLRTSRGTLVNCNRSRGKKQLLRGGESGGPRSVVAACFFAENADGREGPRPSMFSAPTVIVD